MRKEGVTHTVFINDEPCAPRGSRRLLQQRTVDACKVDLDLKRNVSYTVCQGESIARKADVSKAQYM